MTDAASTGFEDGWPAPTVMKTVFGRHSADVKMVVLVDGLRPILTVVVWLRVGPVTTTVKVDVDVESMKVASFSLELELEAVRKHPKM